MSAEPPLDHAAILSVLRSAYGLAADTLTFIPDGTAPAYRAEGPEGRSFVKVLPRTPSGQVMAGRVAAEVPLLRALWEGGVLARVPRPVPTLAGADLADVEGHPLVVSGWIEGGALGEGWEAALGDLAPLLGRLHAGTAGVLGRVDRLPVSPEDFDLPFERGFLEDLRFLRALPRDARPGVHALRDLLLPREDEVRRLLERARSFQQAAQSRPRPLVVCHTDAHGGNVMRDVAERLWIIDWETARLAPPEHDLWMLGGRLAEVLPAYEEGAGRQVALDPDLLGFYLCRRVLEDLAADVDWVLHENTRAEEDAANLAVVERYVLPSLSRVGDDLDGLRQAVG
ncbi:phosphotransferase enzyme family protein [Deinococcus aestuarii]|uniref:phosphotransferase enzyme family protein n=1 Tax=Deinococcus aestuarii TaxID=2774531 RepID=UPI001C0D91E1|nr:aminoglycoside phosphotransferase family protein [Deinococcus aestuarii]